MKLRQRYYDFFSHFYDFLIRLHSQDKNSHLRSYLALKSGVKGKHKVLDLCTGTGALAIVLTEFANEGIVVGLDFSFGMLKKAKEKAKRLKRKNLYFVVADANAFPFKPQTFNIVTCSHAIYELSGQTRHCALKNIKQCLKQGGRFCMMEHEEPRQTFIKFFYLLRLLLMGKEGKQIVCHELDELKKIFTNVVKEVTVRARTKVICGEKRN